jgi:putative Mn2+ efflux pump MntP
MAWWTLPAIAVGLGADALSVSAAIGVRWHGPRQKFRLAWHMGLFQFLMPVIGYFAGSEAAGFLREAASWVGAILVFGIGAKMLLEALRSHPGAAAETAAATVSHPQDSRGGDPTRGWSLLVLMVATSVDALVVGFSLGVTGAAQIWVCATVIGLVAGAMALAGVVLGKRIGAAVGKPAEIAGAAVLMAIAAYLALT